MASDSKLKRKQADSDAEVPAKKAKRSKDFPNPSKDSELSEQAQKSLSYAYTQLKHPNSFKFQKARQNWLVRNCLNPITIPEQHVPLVNQYLQTVQGSARNHITQRCTKALEKPAPTPAPAPESTEPATTPKEADPPPAPAPVTPDETIAEARAKVLLRLLALQPKGAIE